MCTLARWRLLPTEERAPTNAWNPACDYLEASFARLTGVAARVPEQAPS
jgi:hypothetical protein